MSPPAVASPRALCCARLAGRRALRSLALVGSWAWACAAGAAQAGPAVPQAVLAPHYGNTLFEFYQDKTFAALTGLMASQHFGRLDPHDDEAEVLRGGLLLAYGLHREAGGVFAQLIAGNAPPAVRDRAWFLLARMRHQRGLAAEAEAALARIASPLAGAQEIERRLLQAQLLTERGDPAGAAAVLQTVPAAGTAGLVARFNLGVAWVRAGQAPRGAALLDGVGQAPAADEEARNVRDRANVALGFAALQAGDPRQARFALQRVRLSGLQANKALLAYGWAAAGLNDPEAALVPWTELASRGDEGGSDAAVLEARIAVPYALTEIGAYGQALDRYREAAESYEREADALAESMAAVRAGRLTDALVALNPSTGLAAFGGITALPQMPHGAHLAPLLAGHAFQEAFKNLRDLQFLAANLQQWRASLGAFDDMLANRQRAYAQRLPAIRTEAGAADVAGLQQRRDALAVALAQAEADADAQAFATPGERALLQRIARSRATLAQPGVQPELTDAADIAERLRRAAGALVWQMARERPARSWEARKALRATDEALAAARGREAALAQAQRDEPARHARFALRIAGLAARIAALAPKVAAVSVEQQRGLADIAVAALQAQQDRLAVYAGQARLAMAQIHDRALVARRGDGPGAPR